MDSVLIADDNDKNLYFLKTLLQSHGFQTRTASNGEQALAKARKECPTLIISDILMPVMDGFMLCHQCKKDPILKNVPFILYTATYSDPKMKLLPWLRGRIFSFLDLQNWKSLWIRSVRCLSNTNQGK